MKNNIDLIDKVLIKCLLLDGNESSLLEYDDLIKFKFIIVELSKIKYDIRYCEKRKCRCHPESSIEYILKDASDNLIEFLKKENIYEALKELIESYEVKISKYVYDIYLK